MSKAYTSELGIKFTQWRGTDQGRMARQTGEFTQESDNNEAVEIAFLAGARAGEEVGKELADRLQRAIDAKYEC